MSETRVYIVQCLCPSRHCILASPLMLPAELSEQERDAAKVPVIEAVKTLLEHGTINPWCGLCQAPSTLWAFEIGRTRWKTMDEAMPALKNQERMNLESREAILALQQKAREN